MKYAISAAIALALVFAACGDDGDDPAAATTPGAGTTGIPELNGDIVTTATGLKYIDEQVGTGPMPASSQSMVTVHYTGWLENGTKFDSSVDRGQPATFALSGVIKGWTEGVATMRAGGKRRLIIPPELAYGAGGFPPAAAVKTIPPNATLTFDIELISIQ